MNPKPNRRLVLKGAGGFTLALPFLESLFDAKALAADPPTRPRRFVAFGTEHGGVWPQAMYPADATLVASKAYAGRQVKQGPLSVAVSGGVATISPVLSGRSTLLTSALAAKMNVLHGLDVTWYLAHHRGGHLGNFAERDDGVSPAGGPVLPSATIDQVLAWSKTFYPDTTGIRERSMVIGDNGLSSGWSSPSTQSGKIQQLNADNDPLALFNRIFAKSSTAQPRPPIVDLVMEDYRRLRNSNRRLSGEDKRRLDEHVARLSELQRKLTVPVAQCGNVVAPASGGSIRTGDFARNPTTQTRYWQLFNDVIVTAFTCDTSRVATVRVEDTFSTFAGDWHQDVAHKADKDTPSQTMLTQAHQRFFDGVFLDLISKLDAVKESDGTTLLDNCLVQWTQESGVITHDPIEMPVVTAGSAGGFFNTGNYVDYRNKAKIGHPVGMDGVVLPSYIGLVYNQWLGNVLQAMGLPRTEFETGSYAGYGRIYLAGAETDWYGGYNKYGNAELGAMGDVLPFLKK